MAEEQPDASASTPPIITGNDAAMQALLAEKRQQMAEHEQIMLNTHPGDIIQITHPAHDWHPMLLLVDESKKWGVLAIAFQVKPDGSGVGQYPIRLKWGVFQKVGEAVVLPADMLAARRDSIETARLVGEEAKARAE